MFTIHRLYLKKKNLDPGDPRCRNRLEIFRILKEKNQYLINGICCYIRIQTDIHGLRFLAQIVFNNDVLFSGGLIHCTSLVRK